jgi:hypothetical protein
MVGARGDESFHSRTSPRSVIRGNLYWCSIRANRIVVRLYVATAASLCYNFHRGRILTRPKPAFGDTRSLPCRIQAMRVIVIYLFGTWKVWKRHISCCLFGGTVLYWASEEAVEHKKNRRFLFHVMTPWSCPSELRRFLFTGMRHNWSRTSIMNALLQRYPDAMDQSYIRKSCAIRSLLTSGSLCC